MTDNRCVLRNCDGEQISDVELDELVLQLGRAYRQAKAVQDWAECLTHITNAKVDTILEDVNTLLEKAHRTVGASGIRLTN